MQGSKARLDLEYTEREIETERKYEYKGFEI